MNKLTAFALSAMFPVVVTLSMAAVTTTVRAGDLTTDTPFAASSLARAQVQAELLRDRADALQPSWSEQHDPLRLGATRPRYAAALPSAAPPPAERRAAATARPCGACGEDGSSFAPSALPQPAGDDIVIAGTTARR